MSGTISKTWRYIFYALIAVFVLVLLTLTALTLLIATESGSRRVAMSVITRLNQLEGTALEVGSSRGTLLQGLSFDQVSFSNPSINLSSTTFETSWNPYSLLSGNFYLSELLLGETEIDLKQNENASPIDTAQLVAEFQFSPLPVEISVDRLAVGNLVIRNGDQQLTVQSFNTSLNLDQNDLRLMVVSLDANPVRLIMEAQISLSPGLPVDATIDWQYLEPLFELYDSASGNLSISGQLNELALEQQLLTPIAVTSAGSVRNAMTIEALQIDLEHTASDLILPIDAAETFELDDVRLITRFESGILSLALDSSVLTTQYPAIVLSAEGELAGQSLALNSLRLSVDGSSLDGSARLDWSDGIVVNADYTVQSPEPKGLLPIDIPLELTMLSATGELDYRQAGDSQRLDLRLQEMRGQLDVYEVRGNGDVSLIDGQLQVRSLQLATLNNRLELQGRYGDTLQVDWILDARDLGQLNSQYGGNATGSGTIAGTLEAPEIDASLVVQAFESNGVAFDRLGATLSGSAGSYQGDFQIFRAQVDTGEQRQEIENIQVGFDGGLDQHRINAAIESEPATLALELRGGFSDFDARQWAGVINDAQIESIAGDWASDGAAALSLDQDRVQLRNSCWRNAQTRLCIDVSPRDTATYQLQVNLDDFPLAEFNARETSTGATIVRLPDFPRLPQAMQMQGLVTGTLVAALSPSGLESASLELASGDALLSLVSPAEDLEEGPEQAGNQSQQFRWEQLTLSGRLADQAWYLAGRASLAQQDVADSNLSLNGLLEAELTIAANRELAGSATADFAELGWIEAFLPDLSNVKGRVDSTLEISGSQDSPLFAGSARITNGAFTVEAVGVDFHDIDSTFTVDAGGEAQLTGHVGGGDGELNLSGNVMNMYEANRRLTASLSGSDFQFVDIDDLNLVMTPALNLEADSRSIRLSGSLDVPVLDLRLEQLPVTAIDVSRDVVIVSYPSERQDLSRSANANRATLFDIPVTAEVTLNLGEQVSFNGFGLQAQVDGSLDIQQLANGNNLTYGELNISEGSYRMYGQTLELRQGKLLFLGAYDNPALDIRAVREANNVTVGVLMNGTLKNINSQLFSTPVLPETDIIAVLVTGRPFSEMGSQDGDSMLGAIATLGIKTGQPLSNQVRDRLGLDTLAINTTGDINASTLTIGKYLTPDLFVRYGVGLFDKQSKIAMDYKISERVKLQAESGEYQSVDLTYTVER